MARPLKKGLSYFPKDVDYYEDFKIMDLMNEYGPLGQTIYDIVISMVYREGYFLEFEDFEQLKKSLPVKIIKTVGNRWENSKNHVLQVILSCADIGLFDKDLLMQGVITSVGIQKRYDLVTVRSKVHKDKYRLIDENGQPLLNAPLKSVNATETDINATETDINVAKIPQKKIKENKSKENKNTGVYFSDKNLNNVFCLYLMCRKNNGDAVRGEQIRLLIEQLETLSSDNEERIAIVKKATMSNWKSFYPLKKSSSNTAKSKKQTFDQRKMTKDEFSSLEKKIFEAQNKKYDQIIRR